MESSTMRVEELLTTINEIPFSKLDVRLTNYFVEKAKRTGSPTLKITHQLVADELGSVREVIFRLLKQLENNGKIKLSRGIIDISFLV